MIISRAVVTGNKLLSDEC